MFSKLLVRLSAFVVLCLANQAVTAQTSYSLLAGNTSYSFQVCDPAATNQVNAGNQHYFHFVFYRVGTDASHYHVTMTDASQSAPLTVINTSYSVYDSHLLSAGTQCSGTFALHTSNVQSANYTGNGNGDLFDIRSCYIVNGLQTCSNLVWELYLVTTVTPTVAISPGTVITSEGVGVDESVSLPDSHNMPFANQQVSVTTSTTNGAQISVTPSSAYTDITGKAKFTLTANTLRVPLASQTPTGKWIFTATADSQTNIVTAQGSIIQPTIASLSPTSVAVNGLTPFTVTISPVFANVPIDVNCTGTLASVSPATSTQTTDAQGKATFNLTANGLVNINANTAVKPSERCVFSIHGGTASSSLIDYTTYNACGLSLLPLPAGCGNPN